MARQADGTAGGIATPAGIVATAAAVLFWGALAPPVSPFPVFAIGLLFMGWRAPFRQRRTLVSGVVAVAVAVIWMLTAPGTLPGVLVREGSALSVLIAACLRPVPLAAWSRMLLAALATDRLAVSLMLLTDVPTPWVDELGIVAATGAAWLVGPHAGSLRALARAAAIGTGLHGFGGDATAVISVLCAVAVWFVVATQPPRARTVAAGTALLAVMTGTLVAELRTGLMLPGAGGRGPFASLPAGEPWRLAWVRSGFAGTLRTEVHSDGTIRRTKAGEVMEECRIPSASGTLRAVASRVRSTPGWPGDPVRVVFSGASQLELEAGDRMFLISGAPTGNGVLAREGRRWFRRTVEAVTTAERACVAPYPVGDGAVRDHLEDVVRWRHWSRAFPSGHRVGLDALVTPNAERDTAPAGIPDRHEVDG